MHHNINPDISVILPTYNRCLLLKRAINSVLCQSFTNYELLVVDDCSTDNTQDEVLSIQDNRIQYIRHRQNKGGSAARNTGINHSKGNYISFLDDDDEYSLDRLSNLIVALKNKPECGYVLSKMVLKTVDNTIHVPKSNPLPFTYVDVLLGRIPPVYHTTLIRKEVLVYFDESLPRWQDLDFMVRLRQKSQPLFVDKITYICNMHEVHDRITGDTGALEESIRVFEDKYFSKHFNLEKHEKAALYKHAADAALGGSSSVTLGRKYLLRSLLTFPRLSTIAILLSTLAGMSGYRALGKVRTILASAKWSKNSKCT